MTKGAWRVKKAGEKGEGLIARYLTFWGEGVMALTTCR